MKGRTQEVPLRRFHSNFRFGSAAATPCPPPISLEEVARSPTPPAPCIAPTGHPLNPRPGDAWNRWQGAYPQPYPHAYTSHGSLPTPKRSGSMGRRRRRRATHAAAPTTHRALQAEDFVGELHRRLPRPVLVDHGLGGEAGGEDGDEGQGRRTPPPLPPRNRRCPVRARPTHAVGP